MFANSTGLGPLQAIASALETAGPAQPLSQRDAMMMTLRGLSRAGSRGAPPAQRTPVQRSPEQIQQLMQQLMAMRGARTGGRAAPPQTGGPAAPRPGRLDPAAVAANPQGFRENLAGAQRQEATHPGSTYLSQDGQGQGAIAGLLAGLQNLMQQRGQGAQAGAVPGVASDDVLARRRAQRQRMAQTMQNLPRGR